MLIIRFNIQCRQSSTDDVLSDWKRWSNSNLQIVSKIIHEIEHSVMTNEFWQTYIHLYIYIYIYIYIFLSYTTYMSTSICGCSFAEYFLTCEIIFNFYICQLRRIITILRILTKNVKYRRFSMIIHDIHPHISSLTRVSCQ